MTFCTHCMHLFTDYVIRVAVDVIDVRGTEVEYLETIAYCPNCNSEIYIPEINDINAQRRLDAYRDSLRKEEI